jgi:adenine-specific DNA-methyltransferase
LGAEVTTSYNRTDEAGRYSLERLDKQSIRYSSGGDFEIQGPDGISYFPRHKNPKQPNATWRWSPSSVRERFHELVFESGNVYTKNYEKEGAIPRSLLVEERFGRTRTGKTELSGLFASSPFNNPKPSKVEYHLIGLASSSDDVVLDFFGGSGTTAHAAIDATRSGSGRRNYILIEQGAYFEQVLKPRINKVVYSSDWKDGRPTAPKSGISHCFKVIKLESYEDTLNNLQLRRTSAQGDLLNTLPQQAKDDYLLNYQLDVESRASLLSVEDFKKPFDYTLNVAVDSAGAFEPRKIDLVETFNFLIGLRVKHIDAQPQRGFVTVTGTLPSGETCLVLWRDCDVLDYEGISKLCDKLAINPADNEFDVVYINGDHNIPTVLTQTAEEGGATRVLKLRQIEPEFLERMFSVEDI